MSPELRLPFARSFPGRDEAGKLGLAPYQCGDESGRRLQRGGGLVHHAKHRARGRFRLAFFALALAGLVLWAISTRALYQWVGVHWVNAWVVDSEVLTRHWHYYGGHLHLVWCAGAALIWRG